MTESASLLLRDDENDESSPRKTLAISHQEEEDGESGNLTRTLLRRGRMSCRCPSLAQAGSLLLMLISVAWLTWQFLSPATAPPQSGQELHPAVVGLLIVGAWHALLLCQGLVQALPGILKLLGDSESSAYLSSLFADSHPWAYRLVQESQEKSSQIVRGIRFWYIFFSLLLVACVMRAIHTVHTITNCTLARVLSALSVSLLLVCTQRTASLKAASCNLDTLNTPVHVYLVRIALHTDSYLRDSVQLLRWAWQRWAEKPSVLSFSIGRALTALGLVVAALITTHHAYGIQHQPLSLVAFCGSLLLYALGQGVPYAAHNLSPREQEAALCQSTRDRCSEWARDSPHLLSTLCLATISSLSVTPHGLGTPSAWLALLLAALITSLTSQVAQAVAMDFPVTYLTCRPVRAVLALTTILAPCTLAALTLQGMYHRDYQPDDVYIGTKEEWALIHKADVESPSRPRRAQIASYPAPTDNPDVFEEHEF